VGAQAYTNDGDGIYTTDASWLASKLCRAVMTDAEHDEIDPEFAPGMRDFSGDATPSMVARAHSLWPLRFAEWNRRPEASEWKGGRGPYDRCDWVSARRFIQRCARRGVGFNLSY